MPIYLDNAATSFPKPESVYVAMDKANRDFAVCVGRGSYQRANDATRILDQTRGALAKIIAANDAKEISFAFSCTDALCTSIFGFLRSGDHVIASAADHNSVLRPLQQLKKERNVDVTIVPCDQQGIVSTDDIESAIKDSTKLVCLTHASNVTGAIQPVKAVGQLCKKRDVRFLLDAAQTIGHLDIDVNELNCDFLAAPGHKGLLGPLGTGFLFTSSSVAEHCTPFRFGGTGSTGNEFEQPIIAPQKFESGNLNVPGIAGLLEGLRWLETDEAREREGKLQSHCQYLTNELMQIESVTLYGNQQADTPTISFNIDGIDCQTTATLLDSQFEIECRAGLHCAPLIHEPIGSDSSGGTVRFSPGPFSTRNEIESAVSAIQQIADEIGAVR